MCRKQELIRAGARRRWQCVQWSSVDYGKIDAGQLMLATPGQRSAMLRRPQTPLDTPSEGKGALVNSENLEHAEQRDVAKLEVHKSQMDCNLVEPDDG